MTSDFVHTGTEAQVQFAVNALRARFQNRITAPEDRKAFVYLLACYAQTFHFLTCFFTYAAELEEFATFAEYVGPQLIKQGSVSDLMKQIRQTEVVKAAVEYQGVTVSEGSPLIRLLKEPSLRIARIVSFSKVHIAVR